MSPAERRAYGSKQPLLTIGALQIDTVARSVRRGGQPVELTAREYLLLEYLSRRIQRRIVGLSLPPNELLVQLALLQKLMRRKHLPSCPSLRPSPARKTSPTPSQASRAKAWRSWR